MLGSIIYSLHDDLVKILPKYGYNKLTNIQELAIPKILFDNKDLFIISPTGSGKTEAVFFPIISLILKDKSKKLFAIYITPLRSLNRDIFKRMKDICEELGIKISVLHGDTPRSERREIYKDFPHILITTPETFDALTALDLFTSNLSNLNFIVIDEMHELIEGKRGLSLILSIERIKFQTKKKFRIIALSATLNDPIEISSYIFKKEFSIIKSPFSRSADIKIFLSEKNHMESFIKILHEIFKENKSLIIFTNTRSLAEYIGYTLKERLNFEVEVHHSSLGKDIRESVESELKKGKLKAVIATSSLEHGIDMPFVDAVFQYGSPIQSSILKQRVGRSMHKEKLISKGYIMTFNPVEALESYVIAKRANEDNLERMKAHKLPIDLLVHHIVGLLLCLGKIKIQQLYDHIKSIKLFENLSYEDFLNLISVLRTAKLCFEKDDFLFPFKAKCKQYYFDTISTIFEEPLYTCFDISTRKMVGKVDGSYILNAYSNNNGIVLAGKAWKVVSIDEENMRCDLQPITESSEIPIWSGELLPVSKEVAMEVFDLIYELLKNPKSIETLEYSNNLIKLDEHAINSIKSFLNDLTLNYLKLNSKVFIIEKWNRIISLINPSGTKINRTLSVFLKGIFGERIISIVEHPYGLILYFNKEISTKDLINYIFKIPQLVDKDKMFLKELFIKDGRYVSTLRRIALFLGLISKDKIYKVPLKILRSLNDSYAGDFALYEFLYRILEYDEFEEIIDELIKRKIILLELREPSPFTRIYLGKVPYFRDIVKEQSLVNLYEAVEKRLFNEQMYFLCIACKNNFYKKIADLPEKVYCEKCGSVKVACLNPYDEEIMEAAKAFINSNSKILKNKFRNNFARILLSSEIISLYGKTAAMVMAAHGIGPEFARRILIGWKGDKNELIKNIIEYEIKFSQTKKFWKSN